MVQFTREFIINDLKGGLVASDGMVLIGAENGTSKIAEDTNNIYIENLVNIDKKSIHQVYKSKGAKGEKEVFEWTPTLTAIGDTDNCRLIVTLQQDDNVVATFNDYTTSPSRKIVYDFTGKLPSKKIEDLHAIVTLDGTKVKVEATDYFTHVVKVEIVKDAFKDNLGAGVEVIAAIKKGDDNFKVTTPGTPGAGTTAQILRNMRLQTEANLNPYGLDMDERPVAGGIYDMYTVELVTERRHIGHDVMGSIGHSLTTLIFYVLQGDVSTAFGGMFTTTEGVTDDVKVTVKEEIKETGKEEKILDEE